MPNCFKYTILVNVVVCHDQVRRQVSQGLRCRDSQAHELIPPDSAIDPLVPSQSGVWCKRTYFSHLVIKFHSLYRCRLIIAPIAQLVSVLDFIFERAVEGSILTAGKRLSLKNLNVIIRAIN